MIKNDYIKIAGLVLLVIILLIVGPLITIWALNTLFPVLAIPYTFWTWLAMAVLTSGLFYKSSK